jgi:uncharacterized protein YigA (DUF484 family)
MTEPTLPPIAEDDIASYLANTPDFFERHASLLAAVELTSPHSHRAISLQERQAEMLREKIKALELKATGMIRHGHENTAVADRLHRWTRELLLAREVRELPRVVASELAARFLVPQVAIKVWGVASEFAGEDYALGASEDAIAFAHSLSLPYCGANPGLEAAHWLADPTSVASIALVPLRAGIAPVSGEHQLARGLVPLRAGIAPQAFGLLVLASADAGRFTADMGTDFLQRIGELSSAALSRLRP